MGLVVTIGGDVKEAVASIKQLKTELNSLKTSGQLSLGGVQDALKQFQDRLKVATNPREILGLQRSITVLKEKAKELQGSGVDTFAGQFKTLGNGINTAIGPLRQMANILPGIGIAGLVGGLASMVSGLFQSASAFDKASLAAEIFKDKLDDIKAASDGLEDFLDLQNKIGDLQFRIAGGEGADADIENLKNQLKSNNVVIKDATKNLDEFGKKEQELINKTKEISAEFSRFGVKNPLAELALRGKDLSKITKEEADKLPPVLKNLANQFIENRKALIAEDKRLTEATGNETLLRLQIQKTGVEEQKRLFEEAVKNNEKFVRNTISEAKRVSSAFKDGIDLKLDIGFFDNINEQFKKSLDFLSKFNANKFTWIISPKIKGLPVQFPPEEPKKAATEFGTAFKSDLDAYFNKPFVTDFTLIDAVANEGKRLEGIKKQLEELRSLGEFVGNSIANAFDNVFDAIGKGENPIRAVGEAVKALVLDLIKAAIRAFIVQTIINLFAPGAGSAAGGALSGLFGGFGGGFATGGPVAAGRAILVGEKRPEIFIPSESGRIVPNTNMLNGAAAQMVSININGRISGRDIVYSYTQETAYQKRNG